MLLDKLAFTENKYEELSVKISDPSIMANQKEWRKLCKENSELTGKISSAFHGMPCLVGNRQ